MVTNKLLKTEVANQMTTLMRGVITNGTGRSAAIGLGEAGKTGTTNNNVDSMVYWFYSQSSTCNRHLARK